MSDEKTSEMSTKENNILRPESNCDSDCSSSSFHSLNDQAEALTLNATSKEELSANLSKATTNEPQHNKTDINNQEKGEFVIESDESECSEGNPYFIDECQLKDIEFELEEEALKVRHIEAMQIKENGNALFREGKYTPAALTYTEGLNLCPLIHMTDRAILFANRAAARAKGNEENATKHAIGDCNKALELDPSYTKVLLRRANLHKKIDNLDEALNDYKKVLEMEPNNQDALHEATILPQMINDRNEKLKAEMMGKLKDLGNLVLKPFGLSTDNFKLNQDTNTGGYNISFNQNNNR